MFLKVFQSFKTFISIIFMSNVALSSDDNLLIISGSSELTNNLTFLTHHDSCCICHYPKQILEFIYMLLQLVE